MAARTPTEAARTPTNRTPTKADWTPTKAATPTRLRPIGLTPPQARELHAQIRAVMPAQNPAAALINNQNAAVAAVLRVIRRLNPIITGWELDPAAADAEQVRRRDTAKKVLDRLSNGLRQLRNASFGLARVSLEQALDGLTALRLRVPL